MTTPYSIEAVQLESIYYDGTLASAQAIVAWEPRIQIFQKHGPHSLFHNARKNYVTKSGALASRGGSYEQIREDRWIVRDALNNLTLYTEADYQRLFQPKL